MSTTTSRRSFIKGAAAGALGIAAAGCMGTASAMAADAPGAPDAGSNDWLGDEPSIDDSQISSVLDTSLLIVGAGNGGLMAAATAADAGIDFMICEQNVFLGETRYWVGAVDTDAQAEAGVTLEKDRLLNELGRYASYKCNMGVIKLWIEHSAEMVSYLESLGMTSSVHVAPDSHVGGNNMDYYVPSTWHSLELPADNPFAAYLGAERNGFLENHINEKGYEVQYEMTLVKLLHSDAGKVTGAIFTNGDDEYVQINADNVILATGGYPANPDMIEALAPIVVESCTADSYYGTDNGQGIKAGLWAGAKMDSACAPMVFDRGLVAPGVKCGYVDNGNGGKVFPGTVYQYNPGTQPYLKVNKEGQRFANESCPYDFFNFAASLQTDGVYAAIMDANVEEDIIAYDQYGCAQMAVDMARGGAILPQMEGYVEEGLMFKADTIEDLADQLGIPADTLAATVARYNELCEEGVDEDFGKEAYRMRPINTAPYYGFFMGGSLLTTCDGLRINNKCQVYDTNHQIIEGLYAVGDCSGSFFSGNYPEYFVGVAVGRTLTEGRYAVKSILGEEF